MRSQEVFISYSSADREAASVLADKLRSCGFLVWMDSIGIGAATRWSAEIAQALDTCRAVILLLSSYSVASTNVLKEVTLAAEAEKLIIPVELQKVVLPTSFKYHLAGLQRTTIDNLDAITNALGSIGLGRTNVPAVVPIAFDKQPRIAVIPFEDQSPAHDNEWFSDGLTDELTSMLGKLEGIFVVDKQSSREYKLSRLNVKQIANELGVRYIVTGAVRKHEKQIRISCSLVDASNGTTLWDEKFPGTMEDIFEIQERVAAEITAGMRVALTPEEKNRLEERLTANPEAYEFLLRANEHLSHNSKEDFLHAITLYERCLEIDPTCVSGYTGLISSLTGMYEFHEQSPMWLDRAEGVIESMVQHVDQPLQVLIVRAEIGAHRGNTVEARGFADAASVMEHGSFSTLNRLAEAYAALGEPRRAAEEWERALLFMPEHTTVLFNVMTTYGQYLNDPLAARSYAERLLPLARDRARKHPSDVAQQVAYAITLEYGGDFAGWDAQLQRALAMSHIDGFALWLAAASLARQSRVEQTIDILKRVFSRLQIDPAFILTERSFDHIKDDPRFAQFLRELSSLQAGVATGSIQ